MPLKRNINIVELSKDHHFGLLFCWKITQGLSKDIELDRIKNYVAYFWLNHFITHFKEEEEIIFNVYEDALCNKAKEEHQIIKNEIEAIINLKNQDKNHFSHLTNFIKEHIRFEERILFPHLELILSDEELQNIGDKIKQSHHIFKDDYADEFWL